MSPQPQEYSAGQPIEHTDAWAQVVDCVERMGDTSLRELFRSSPSRAEDYSVTAGDLFIDFSKNLIDDDTFAALVSLARTAGVEAQRFAMFEGEAINSTENRSALHTALRRPSDDTVVVNGENVIPAIHDVLNRMSRFTSAVHDGSWTGFTGKKIQRVVNIGIGGSDLGPQMVCRALQHHNVHGIRSDFVSNVDPADIYSVLSQCDPETTLFLVVSKTFTTQETLTNAHIAKGWLIDKLGSEEAVANHFVAISTNEADVATFGIDTRQAMFEFWDWVGGRYSVDSAVGLTVMLTIGPSAFIEFLEGFGRMDQHFRNEAIEHNAPFIMGLLSVWYTTFLGAQSKAVIPYSHDLALFPAYMQQLVMESNGKSVRADGSDVAFCTGEIIWGEAGTNGQHAFHQLLHQGTQLCPVDFIGFTQPAVDYQVPEQTALSQESMHDLLISNLLAQSQVLAFGKTTEELIEQGIDPQLAAHKTMPGNRPSTTILAASLSPSVLGQLIALYEHAVFVQASLLGVNAFDQWGVELGKTNAAGLLPLLTMENPPQQNFDSSTHSLLMKYRQARGRKI